MSDTLQDKILKLFAKNDCRDSLYWTESLKFGILCNDIFLWGSSDIELIETEQDLELLSKCFDDCAEYSEDDASFLYCARKRGVRPQGAAYSLFDPRNWHLFDECGPEREVGIGNPYRPGEYKDLR